MTPTQLSLNLLRKEGYLVAVVEKWNWVVKIRQDLFGFIDIIAIKEGETVGVQTTSIAGVSARRKKILEHENFSRILSAGWRIELHGWKKRKNRWETKREVLIEK